MTCGCSFHAHLILGSKITIAVVTRLVKNRVLFCHTLGRRNRGNIVKTIEAFRKEWHSGLHNTRNWSAVWPICKGHFLSDPRILCRSHIFAAVTDSSPRMHTRRLSYRRLSSSQVRITRYKADHTPKWQWNSKGEIKNNNQKKRHRTCVAVGLEPGPY